MKAIIKGKKYDGEMSVLAVNMDKQEYVALKQMALDRGQSASAIVRELITQELENHKKERDENSSPA